MKKENKKIKAKDGPIKENAISAADLCQLCFDGKIILKDVQYFCIECNAIDNIPIIKNGNNPDIEVNLIKLNYS